MQKRLESGMVLLTDGENSGRDDLERIARTLNGGWGLADAIQQSRWKGGAAYNDENEHDIWADGRRYGLISKRDNSSRVYVRRV